MSRMGSAEFAHVVWSSCLSVLVVFASVDCSEAQAQDLSWVKGAMERSKLGTRDSLPLWQYDPRVAAGSADASLHAVTSASADSLWAVGDRGLILASQNGGHTWTQQASFTTLNLYAVSFINERQGFIVGGTIQPMSRTSVGIVLATDDAGETWRAITTPSLSRMTGLSIAQRGVLTAWGDYSPFHNSSIIESHDRGQTWRAVASPLGHLQTVARQAGGLQLGVDRAGRISQLPARMDHVLKQLAPPTLPIAALVHTGSQWIAVGHGGTLAASSDSLRWVDRPLPLSPAARAACNLRCLTSFDRHVWAAGEPGSVLLHSEDYGDSWRIHPSDQSWPINAIHFFDQHRGWAVTDAGSIVATRDGGKSWFLQRQPLKRLGMQAFASSSTEISWPALADAVWQAKQATALSVLHRENTEDAVDYAPDGPTTLATIGTQAALVSAAQSSKHPLADRRVRHPRGLANYYHGSLSGKASNELTYGHDITAELAMQLRMGRPTVVLVDDMHAGDSTHLTEAVVRAVDRAGSREADLSWLDRELHLPPWQVNKVFTFSPGNQADFTIARDQMLGDSGLSVIDALAPVLGFDSNGWTNAPLRCLQLSSTSLAARTTIFHATDRHGDSTRPVDLSKVGNFQLVMGRVHRDKAWQALAPNTLGSEENLTSWLKKLESIIEKTPRHEVGPALVQLANINFRCGNWDRWYATLERAVAHAPQSDTSRWCALEEMRVGASDERLAWELSLQARRERNADQEAIQLANARKPIAGLSNTPDSTPFENDADVQAAPANTSVAGSARVVTASAEVPVAGAEVGRAVASRLSALKRAVRDFSELSQADPALVRRPDSQLAHFAHRRALAELGGEPSPDPTVVQAIASGPPLAGWKQVAEQELVLASGRQTLPNWTARARATSEPPRLDGRDNEPFWEQATPIELTSPFDSQSTLPASTARFAYDAEYLYVMLVCPAFEGSADVKSAREPRKRDISLDGTDHLQLVLDTDRDYTSACELAVNDAGHVFDRCCEASQWNPSCYVAVERGAQAWTAELAIKLSDMTTAPSVEGRAWAISAFRYIPKCDVQSWSQLRSYNPRHQGNGLLVFDP